MREKGREGEWGEENKGSGVYGGRGGKGVSGTECMGRAHHIR